MLTWLGGWTRDLGRSQDGSAYPAMGAVPVRPADCLKTELAPGQQGGATGGAVVAACSIYMVAGLV